MNCINCWGNSLFFIFVMATSNYIPFMILAGIMCLASCVNMQRTDLYFGTNIPDGGQVTAMEWKNFSDSVITKYFSEGYTETNAIGKWLDTNNKKTISENTKVVTFIGRRSKRRNILLNRLIKSYIDRFHQQSVLRVDSKIKYQFITKKSID